MSNAIAVLDGARERVQAAHAGDETAAQKLMEQVFGRISFFVNAGVRFVEEHAKLRAMSILWEELGRERYGVQRCSATCASATACRSTRWASPRPSPRTTCSASCSRRSPSRSGATRAHARSSCRLGTRRSGLPRPWDQQWSLRIQQVLAYETDILEYPDIFEGSKVMDGLVAELLRGCTRGDGRGRRARRRGAGGPLHEGRAGGLPPRAHPPHRVRRAGRRRPEPLHRDRRLAADRRRRGRHPRRRPRGGEPSRSRRCAAGAPSATRRRWTRALSELAQGRREDAAKRT